MHRRYPDTDHDMTFGNIRLNVTPRDFRIIGMAFSIAAMLVVAPLVATTTLVCWSPELWVGEVSPIWIPVLILAMSIFGVLTVPLWPTYIPAIILTPFAMQWLSRRRLFARIPMVLLLVLAIPLGAAGGLGIMAPLLGPMAEDPDMWWNWAEAGLMSGAVTFTLILALHKALLGFVNNRAEPSPPPLPRARRGHSEGEG